MNDETGQGDIPLGVDQILRYLAEKARGYGNRLKWNEVAKLKSDLMLVPERWHDVPRTRLAVPPPARHAC